VTRTTSLLGYAYLCALVRMQSMCLGGVASVLDFTTQQWA